MLEESGLGIHSVYPVGSFYSNPARQTNKVYTFLGVGAHNVSDQKLDYTESIHSEFFSISDLEHYIKTGLFSQGLHIGSWYQAKMMAPADIKNRIF